MPLSRTILTVLSVLVLVGFADARAEETKIPPKVAGTFYSEDPQELASQIERFFFQAPSKTMPTKPIALWVPHAGLSYSGALAAAAYYEVKGKPYDTIVLVGPSHRHPVQIASVYPEGSFQTPLGEVPIDEELAKKITQELPEAKFDPQSYATEHSLEVQLPFLLKVFPKPKVVEILVGRMDLDVHKRVGQAIAKACAGRDILLIASSDMSHYPKGADATRVDNNSLKIIRLFDPDLLPGYTRFFMSTGVENLDTLFCGAGALVAVMEAAKQMGANEARIIGYTNSATVTGNRSRAVGYGAAAFINNPEGSSLKAPDPQGFLEDPVSQQKMLGIARQAIQGKASGQGQLNIPIEDPEFFRPRRVFVTINKDQNLRGCIGNPNRDLPMYEAIVRMATAAGFSDSRFTPLTEQEALEVKIKISVLHGFRRVQSAEEIELNTHGVIVRKDGQEGLFLPEVAESLPEKEQFLSRLCTEKAGLSADAWKDPDTELWVFETLGFTEEGF